MPRQLPARPNLEHLKSQAKDLLDGHRRGEADAFARIRTSVPAFAAMSDEQLARAPFALHDAQSAIAREYGLVSWAELRIQVAALTAEPAMAAEPAGAAQPTAIRSAAGPALLPKEEATLRAAGERPTPERVPVLPLRNAVVFPGSVVPIDVARPGSVRALDAVEQHEPRFLAIFAQRASETDRPAVDDLHTNGCLCVVLRVVLRHERNEGGARRSIVVAGVRWVTLAALEQVDPYYLARITETAVAGGDDAEIAALDRRLREMARKVDQRLPADRDAALALIDQIQDTGKLSDLIMSHMPLPVAESAAYALEPSLVRRIERALAAIEDELAKASVAEPG